MVSIISNYFLDPVSLAGSGCGIQSSPAASCGAMQRGRWSPGFHVVEGLGKQEALEFLISMGVRQISYSQTLGSINYLD